MNLYALAVFASLACGIYAPVPIIRGDAALGLGVGPPAAIMKPLGPPNRPPQCYDNQVHMDQSFDDTFICTNNLTYPTAEIAYALRHPSNRQYYNYLQMAGMCFNEENFYTEQFTAPDYKLKCTCKSNRRTITAVYYNNQKCHLVDSARQKIYFSYCEGPCDLSYGSIEGYFCVNRGLVERSFLVYCEANTEAFTSYTHGLAFQNHDIGGFYYMNQRLPTYCGCRGYFGCQK